jgi:hypothetical protein
MLAGWIASLPMFGSMEYKMSERTGWPSVSKYAEDNVLIKWNGVAALPAWPSDFAQGFRRPCSTYRYRTVGHPDSCQETP